MNIRYVSSAAVVGISIAIVQPQIAQALSTQEVDKIAESITVLIEGPTSGSGFIIKREGSTYTVLTAQHVVNRQGTYSAITPDQKRYPLDYSIIKRFSGVDLAIITFKSEQSYSIAKLGDSTASSRGMNCYVTGFPGRGNAITEPTYTFTQGKLAAIGSRPQADGYALMYNNGTLPGMSGGPVLNDLGEVIGVHGRGVEATAKQSDINPSIAVIKTEYNLGIPINTFLTLAPKLDSKLALRTPAPISQLPRADDFFLQAEQKSKNSDFEAALKDYDRAITLNPQYAEAYASRGNIYASLSNFKKALKDIDQAILLNPKLPNAYINRGGIRTNYGDYHGALEDAEKAIALNPKSADAYILRSSAHNTLNNYEQALKDADQAIALDPKSEDAYIGRAFIRSFLNNNEGALRDANQAIALNPKSVQAYLARANIYVGLNDNQRALKDAGQAIALNPKSALAYFELGNIRFGLGDYQGALKDANQSIVLNPKNGQPYLVRAFAYYALSNYQDALKDVNQAINLVPNFADAYFLRGLSRSKLQDKAGALADLQKASILAKQRNNVRLYQNAQQAVQRLIGE